MTDSIEVREKPDSVKVNRNAKGDYSFEVKRYFDAGDTPSEEIVAYIEDIYNKLGKVFV